MSRRRSAGARWCLGGAAAIGVAAATLAAAALTGGERLVGEADAGAGEGATVSAPSRLADCGAVAVRGDTASGGCRVRLMRGRIRLDVVSLFGDQPLGDCPFRFTAQLGADGTLALSRIEIVDDVDPACGDFLACRADVDAPESAPTLPWRARYRPSADGVPRVTAAACFDTCFGRFEGPLELRLTPASHGAWRLSATGAPVGRSGLEVSGTWRARPS